MARLILEDGHIIEGKRLGYEEDICVELVFNTSMTGYLEILTDPSYAGQAVVMTYPLIGNYGINEADGEARHPWAEAIVVQEISEFGSNFRSEACLASYLTKHKLTCIYDVDTRALTKLLRDRGTMKCVITSNDALQYEDCKALLNAFNPIDLVQKVSSKEIIHYKGTGYRIALIDYGAKKNIVHSLLKRKCDVTIFPYYVTVEKIKEFAPDGIMLTNGPGDPKDCQMMIENLKRIYALDIPIFGICLGHQLMALAAGADTKKLKYGHRGGNHPVKDIEKDRVYITAQNHGYYVVHDSIPENIAEVSHVNVNDNTVEGIRYKHKPIFTVQFHPEAAPGPEDTGYLFDDFMEVIGGHKNA